MLRIKLVFDLWVDFGFSRFKMKFVSDSGISFDFSIFKMRLDSVSGITFDFSIFKVGLISGVLLIVGKRLEFSAVFKVSKSIVFEAYI